MVCRTASLLLAAAVVSSVGRAVQEEKVSFSCCKPLLFAFDPKHRNLWSHNDKNFADLSNGKTECIAPCKGVKNEEMELEDCVEIRHQETWEHMNSAMEKRIHYIPQPCAASAAGNPGVPGVLLLALITTVFVNKMIC